MNFGIPLALVSALAYGAADFIGGVGARRHSPWQIAFVGQGAGGLVMLAVGLLLPGTPTAPDFAWALLAGIGSATGGIALYRGLARGRMGLVAPISGIGAAVIPLLAGVAFGERPGWLVWIGIVAALPGIWLVSRGSGSDPSADARAGLVDGVVAGAGFGVLFIALAQISDDAGLLPLAANQFVGAAATMAAAAALGQAWHPAPDVLGWGASSGVLGAAGTLSFMLATGATGLAIASVLTSLYPAITVLFAAAILRERVSLGQRAGIAICTLAVAAMALG
jgi:drug/metabolite transporter (DMT)-like permease